MQDLAGVLAVMFQRHAQQGANGVIRVVEIRIGNARGEFQQAGADVLEVPQEGGGGMGAQALHDRGVDGVHTGKREVEQLHGLAAQVLFQRFKFTLLPEHAVGEDLLDGPLIGRHGPTRLLLIEAGDGGDQVAALGTQPVAQLLGGRGAARPG